MNRHRSCRQNTPPRIFVRHRRHNRAAEVFVQALISQEYKQAILSQRPAECPSDLMPAEVRLFVDVKVIARVECAVAMEAECAAAQQVGAGFSDDVNLTTRAAAIFGAIAVRGEPELANRLHSQRSA